MKVDISGHHVEVTDSLRAYVNEKFERLARHFDNVIDAYVVLEVEKMNQKAEANLQLAGNKIHAEASENDMYAAIDALVDKLDRQVIKHKEKTKNHRAVKNNVAE